MTIQVLQNSPTGQWSQSVLCVPELLFLIFEALVESPTPGRKSTRSCMLNYMTVCKYWYYVIRRTFWTHLEKPNEAFNAILYQYDGNLLSLSAESRFLRRPEMAYWRYQEYAALVRTMRNYNVNDEHQESLLRALRLLDISPPLFPRLTSLDLYVPSGNFSFPIYFQTERITSMSIQFSQGYSSAARIGFLHQVADSCPILENLRFKNDLCHAEFDFLRPGPFPCLQNLAVRLKYSEFDEIMKAILSASYKLTTLEVCLSDEANGFLPTRYRGRSLDRLHSLNFNVNDATALVTIMKAFPRAPNLRSFGLEVTVSTPVKTCNAILRNLEEFGQSSPFSTLTVSIPTSFTSRDPVIILPLLRMRRLTVIAVSIRYGAELEMIKASQAVGVWPELRTMKVVVGERCYSEVKDLVKPDDS